MIKIAQIGIGYWGPNILRNLMSNNNFDVKYVVDFSEERLSFVSENYPEVKTTKELREVLLDKSVDDRLDGSLAAAVISLVNKASIIRTHDVLETKIVSNAIRRIIDAA